MAGAEEERRAAAARDQEDQDRMKNFDIPGLLLPPGLILGVVSQRLRL